MALFTDASLIGISDLEIYESTLSQVASTHNINLDSETTITLAAIGDRLLARLVRAGSVVPTRLHPASTRLVSLPPQTAWPLTLHNVVVTPPLERWICYELLSRVFSEAYNVQLNDRFKAKWTGYAQKSRDTERNLYDLGVGVVYEPLPQPPAAQVTIGAGTQSAGIVTVQTAWVDSTGNEGALSPLMPVTLTNSSTFSVSIGTPQSAVPAAAAGWNVYVGTNGLSATRQNLMPILWSTVWPLPASGVVAGPAPLGGQQPDCYVLDPQRVQRG